MEGTFDKEEHLLYTIAEVAAILKVNRNFVYRLINNAKYGQRAWHRGKIGVKIYVKITAMLAVFILMAESASAASVAELIGAAVMPIGKCLYVYGGGWNEADDGAGIEALSLGVSQGWVDFYNRNGSDYDYGKTRYQIHNGLDCTGYIGWSMYQVFENQYSESGYVYQAKYMAQKYAEIFGGRVIPKAEITDYQCGDIMASSSHAYIVIGQCSDGSVLFLHASPPNVSLCGTYTPLGGTSSEAIRLANKYMGLYFKECYEKFPRCYRNTSYLTDYNQMRWNAGVLTDTDGYRQMSPEEILQDVFENIKIYINGNRLFTDARYYNGSIYAPLRSVAESLGAEVSWDNAAQKASVSADGVNIEVLVNEDKISVGETVNDVYIFVENAVTYAPVRLICESMGTEVEWNGARQAVEITN